MSNRAMAVAIALQTEMPELLVITTPYTRETNPVSCADSPVIVVSDGVARGFTVSVYGDEGDDITSLTADVYRITQKGFAIGDSETPTDLLLGFQHGEPMFDDSDFRVGERLHFVTILHSSTEMAAA